MVLNILPDTTSLLTLLQDKFDWWTVARWWKAVLKFWEVMNGILFAMITGTTMKPGKTEIAKYLLGGLIEGKVYLFIYFIWAPSKGKIPHSRITTKTRKLHEAL